MFENEPEAKAHGPDSPSDTGAGDTAVVNIESQTFAYPEDRKLGITGAVFLLLNNMIGTGIFSTPSAIFAATGSVGASLLLWLAGGILAFCGISIYLEFGLAIPRSGAEKNYLERVYRHPRSLASCVLAFRGVLLGFASANCLSFGRYALSAAGRHSDGWAARGLGVACISFAALMHSVFPKWAFRLLSLLGTFKVGTLLFVVFSGFAALAGHRRVPDPHNFRDAFKVWDGGGDGGDSGVSGSPYAYCNAFLSIVYSYDGWSGVNYVVGEVMRPRRTLSIAVPLAVGIVTVLYLLANVAYLATISKQQMAKAEILVAATFFEIMFGRAGARALPVLVMLSNLSNVLAANFRHSRLSQELAKEGLLPFSTLWASNTPFNTPMAALFLNWLVTVVVLVAPPLGPAYILIINLNIYPFAWIQTFVTIGLLWLHFAKREGWSSPWHTPLPVCVVYLVSNVFLLAMPLIPPQGKWNQNGYPYYVYPFVGIGVLFLGALYWALWIKALPYFGRYRVVSERTYSEDGHEVVRYHKTAVLRHSCWRSGAGKQGQ